MAAGTYNTQTLMGLVPSVQQPALAFRNRVFSATVTSESEEVFFDRLADDIRIAPLVSPIMQGKVVEDQQFSTEFITPAYVKFKFPLRPAEMLKRSAGERLGGSLSLAQRKDARVMQLMAKGELMRARREELMAVEILRTGSVTIAGDGYGTRLVNFQRDAALSVTLAGGDLWSGTGNPASDLETWSFAAQNAPGGAPLSEYWMDPKGFKLLKARLTARNELAMLDTTYRGSNSTLELGPLREKVTYVGRLGTFDIYVYQDWYENEAGVVTQFMPDNTVIGVGAAGGVRAYGAIMDFDQLNAQEVFWKTFREDDPSVEYLMCQSAPILVPTRVNATFRATVA